MGATEFYGHDTVTLLQWVYAPGQSGQLGSPHYDDLIDAWRTGQTIPMLWTRAQVEGRLVLKS
jgi:acyl-homoserine lactone acylase PvdQ